MMMLKFNPYRPSSIVHPGMFAGRFQEMKIAERCLFQTKNGNPGNLIIKGERGIGKSSMMMNLQGTSIGNLTPLELDKKFNFICLSLVLEQTNTFEEIILRIGSELRRKIEDIYRGTATFKDVWSFVTSWEVMGVSYREKVEKKESFELLDELVHLVIKANNNFIKDGYDGLIILLDEADKPSSAARLGDILKIFVESLSKGGCNNVLVGLCGLPELLSTLGKSHQSSVRNVQVIELDKLSREESVQAIQLGIDDANKKNEQKTTITTEAMNMIVSAADGYPHFIQQFAYSAFDVDVDNIIDANDFTKSLWADHGAFHQLGERFFSNLYFKEIYSEDYRKILRVMSGYVTETSEGWVSKTDLRRKAQVKETSLRNALVALKKRGIITADKTRSGYYRVPNRPFAIWLGLLALSDVEIEIKPKITLPTVAE
jgi:hypothetical protein